MNDTVWANWEVNYGAERPRIFNWWEWELVQQFVADKAVASIVFYAHGINQKRLDVATLTEDELVGVTRAWIDAKKRELGLD